jgi:hypothetical protein
MPSEPDSDSEMEPGGDAVGLEELLEGPGPMSAMGPFSTDLLLAPCTQQKHSAWQPSAEAFVLHNKLHKK